MRLQYTDAHYRVMLRVTAGAVLFHDACEPHAPGFSWRESDMCQDVLDMLAELYHARHVSVGTHQLWGSPVSVSTEGRARMQEHAERMQPLGCAL